MQFESLELHVVDALGQQEVPDTTFLYARLFGDRDTDLGGNEIFMRPPKILVETKVVDDFVVWKIKKACMACALRPLLGRQKGITL